MEWVASAVGVAVVLVLIGAWLDAQARLARIERKLNGLLRHQGLDPAPASLSERVRGLADDPDGRIEAIKAYRQETGAGLAEAKAAVDGYVHGR